MHTVDDSSCFFLKKKGFNYSVTLFSVLRQMDHLTRHLASGAMRATLGRPHFVTLLCTIRVARKLGVSTNDSLLQKFKDKRKLQLADMKFSH
jgi:hypothetical protein